jgi:hypothetical protein
MTFSQIGNGMKIYDWNQAGGSAAAGTGRTQETQPADRAAGARSGGTAGGGSDRIEFSDALGQLSRAMSQLGADRAARVQILAAEYQSGAYRPDATATSRGMVAEALLGGGQ